MKKIYLLSLFALATTTTFAQIKFAPEFGLNLAMQNRKLPSQSITTLNETEKIAPGLTAGLNLDIKILRNLYINTGVNYVFNNNKRTNLHDYSHYMGNREELRAQFGDLTESRVYHLHYLRAPVYIMYKSGFEGTGRFTAGLGAYVGYAMGGNLLQSYYTIQSDDVNPSLAHYKTNSKLAFDDDSMSVFKRWDYGLNGCIGYESNVGMYFRAWANYGLANLNPYTGTNSVEIRNWGVGLSVGFLIGKDTW